MQQILSYIHDIHPNILSVIAIFVTFASALAGILVVRRRKERRSSGIHTSIIVKNNKDSKTDFSKSNFGIITDGVKDDEYKKNY